MPFPTGSNRGSLIVRWMCKPLHCGASWKLRLCNLSPNLFGVDDDWLSLSLGGGGHLLMISVTQVFTWAFKLSNTTTRVEGLLGACCTIVWSTRWCSGPVVVTCCVLATRLKGWCATVCSSCLWALTGDAVAESAMLLLCVSIVLPFKPDTLKPAACHQHR